MLQHLERPERSAELLARPAVFEGRRIQFRHRADGFRAQRRDGAVAARLQYSDTLTFRSQQLAGRHLHVHQRHFGGASAVDRPEALQVKIGRMAVDHKETDPITIARPARCPRRDDQFVSPRRPDHRRRQLDQERERNQNSRHHE